jgi:hypothetical protein
MIDFESYIEVLEGQNLENIVIYSLKDKKLIISNYFESKDFENNNFENVLEQEELKISDKIYNLHTTDYLKMIFIGNNENHDEFIIGCLNENILIFSTFTTKFSKEDYYSLTSLLSTILEDIDEKVKSLENKNEDCTISEN